MTAHLDRRQVIERLRGQAEAVRSCGATSLTVYGSVARDEAGVTSDIDLFIDDDPASRFNAFDLIGIKLMLEERLDSTVDITTRDGLHPMLKADIEASALQVFSWHAISDMRFQTCAFRHERRGPRSHGNACERSETSSGTHITGSPTRSSGASSSTKSPLSNARLPGCRRSIPRHRHGRVPAVVLTWKFAFRRSRIVPHRPLV